MVKMVIEIKKINVIFFFTKISSFNFELNKETETSFELFIEDFVL